MKTISIITLLAAISCTPKENETALNPDTGDTEETDTEDTDTEETDTEETDTEETDTEETDTEETDTEDTNTDDTDTDDTDPLANATCDPNFARCTLQDFEDNDFRNETGVISIAMVNMQAYSPKCVTVKVGQTVQIGATGSHPFKSECAEDTVFDSQDLSQEQVEVTFSTPGYYNHRCAISSHVNMVGNIRVMPN